MNVLREHLAKYAHNAWSGWMKYMFMKGEFSKSDDGTVLWDMPSWAVDRWQRQMNTPYDDLPEPEKKSDRDEADKIMTILKESALNLAGPDWKSAPTWAEWWCWHHEGYGVWSENKPLLANGLWLVAGGRREVGHFGSVPLGVDYRLLLQRRPGEGE